MSVVVTDELTMDDLAALIDSLFARFDTLSGEAASTVLSQLAVLSAKLDACRVTLVSRIQDSDVWSQRNPAATAASFLREHHVLDVREAKSDLAAAESFQEFPALAAACRDGRVSRPKLDLITRTAMHSPARREAFGSFVEIFTDLAASVSCRELRNTLDLWAEQIDPVTVGRDDHDAHQRRELHVHVLGDGVKVDGFFDKPAGLRLITALNGVLDRSWRHANDPNQTGHVTVPPDPSKVLPSTAAQRADALINGIVDPVLENGLVPTSGGSPATIVVAIPLHRLQSPEAAATDDELRDRLASDVLRLHSPTVQANNGPGQAIISTATARELSCDATIQRVIHTPAGKPLDIGRKTRVIPEHIRTALVIRDGGCIYPYCDNPPGWAHAHHVEHWVNGGRTSLDNLALLCSKHHHQVHADRTPIEFDSDGKPRVLLEHRYGNQRPAVGSRSP